MSADGTNGTTATASSSSPTADPPIQWDGDRMFNIYIHDYCQKRGFRKTAHELQLEAAIPPASQPPINAKQGLLFEWWSVFWVLFTAKSNGHGPDEAILYTQHQAQVQNAQKRNAQQQGQQPQPARFANGANGVRPPNHTGPQPNGVGPPPTQQTGPLTNGTGSIPFPGNMSQPNGIPGTSAGPHGAASHPPGQNMTHGLPGQRPAPPQQQQRAMNGAPFQSPTMAHSPPNHSGAPQPPNSIGSMGPVGANQSLTQGGMHPPNGPRVPMGQQQTPQPVFQSLGRSPSNPGSPAQGNLTHPSPSMQHRQVPLDPEIARIPPQALQKIKQDLNMSDKEVTAMTQDEKTQVVSHWRRSYQMKPSSMSGPSAIPGGQQGPMQPPSNLRNTQLPPPNAQQQQGQPLPPQAQNQQQRKRGSTSPGQEPEQLPRNESSPPDRKRLRTTPSGGDQPPQPPPMTPMYPPSMHQQQPGGPSMQPPMAPGSIMRGMQMGSPFPGQPMPGMNNQMLGHGLANPQMSPMNPSMNQGMNPGMMSGPPPGGMVNNNQQMNQAVQYRQAMQHLHKPPHLHQMMPGGVPSPSGNDAQGGMPGGPPSGNRMGQNKPMSGMMPPPPPSPAMAAKATGGPMKQDDPVAPNASPQNAAVGIGGQGPGQNPGPGVPGGPPQASTPAPHTPNTSATSTMTVPSPSAMMNSSTPQMSNHPPPPPPPPTSDGLDPNSFAGIDFSGAGFSDLDPNIFNSDSSLNFERDFAAWFDPESTA